MTNLDSLEKIKELDSENGLGSIEALPNQCLHAWEEAEKVKVSDAYKDVTSIVMCGMGGSGLGARVIESLYKNKLNVPFVRVNGYDLPGFVGSDTLVICSSYSGNTEETVENINQAVEKGAKILCITTGGKLNEIAKKEQIPTYIIDPEHNPSNQPRVAIGYSIVGLLALLSKTGLIKIEKEDIEVSVDAMKSVINNKKSLKKLAKELKDRQLLFISSSHLVGAMHTVNNQFNENAKTLSMDHEIPELNHHLMEGLKYPKSNKENLLVLIAKSNLYSEKIQKRIEVTKDVVEKNKIECKTVSLKSDKKISQVFELIQIGAFVNFYLSILYNQNPAPIPWVDYFKEQLKK